MVKGRIERNTLRVAKTLTLALLAVVFFTVPDSDCGLPRVVAADSFDQVAAAATAAREAGRLEEAVTSYRRAVELRADWQEGWWYLGTVLYELDRYAEAREAFRPLIDLTPDLGPAWAFLGLCRFHTGEYSDALADLQKARALGIGGNVQLTYVVRYHMALLLTRVGRFEDAYEVLKFMAYERIRNQNVIEALGLCTLRMPILPREIPPQQRDLIIQTGRAAYEFAGANYDLADSLFEEVVRRYPDVPNLHYAYGTFLVEMLVHRGRDRGRALEQFRRELEISPNHVPALLQLAFDLIERGDFEDARPYVVRALELEPDGFAGHKAVGRIELESGNVAAAVESLERARRLEPASPEIRFTLARAYRAAGREDDAARERAEFTRLLKLKEETLRRLH